MIPISMAIHERNDKDGTIWGSFSAMNFQEQRFYQGIFTVDSQGVRKVVGMYDYGNWDANACGKDDEYIGDKTLLPGYIHSITSTDQYIILPITSLLINPCKFKEPPMTNTKSPIQKGGLWGMDFYDMVPMRFLIFNKKTRDWITQKPLEVFPSMFVTHQLNSFENPDGTVVADMIVYDSHDPYVKYFYTDFLTTQLYPSAARILRFTLDIKAHRVMYNYLIPQETIAGDFPQINHAYEGRAYQWAYLIEHPFASDNVILKINVDDPAGSRNLKFKGDPSLVLHEPWFVPRPDARREDDGVLLIRALDLSENKGILLVVDATTMTEIGRAYVPISIPFGFHNRFFSKPDLGLPEGFSVNQFRPTVPTTQTASPTTATWTKITVASTVVPETSEITTHPTSHSTWQPVSASSEKPWWQRVQSTSTEFISMMPTRRLTTRRPSIIERTHLPPHPQTPFPELITSRSRPTTPRTLFPKSSLVPEPSANTISPPPSSSKNLQTVKELYEETLKALCRWLPKVFKSISQETCLENGLKAIKWMIPVASSYADQMHLPNPLNSETPSQAFIDKLKIVLICNGHDMC
uniref:Uncharacterized protein n=1 Tax=Acrobeloides nanus TaxID=290746 RepID=A0A914DER2_9BILA